MVLVYSEPLYRRYYASRFSLAYVGFAVIALIAIILPFFLAYSNTPNFWLKTSTYREQPSVLYNHKTVVLLHGRRDDGSLFKLFFSTMSALNALYSADLRLPVLRATPLDTNRDGRVDRFVAEVAMPLLPSEHIYSAQVANLFTVRLKDRARLEFEALAFAEKEAGLPGAGLYVDGDFVLKQTWPLKPIGGYWTPYSDEPLIDPESPTFLEGHIPRLLAAVAARNYTCDLVKRHESWAPSAGPPANSPDSYVFNVTMDMRVPIADVLYTPTATEVLKAAWIRYLSLAVLVYYLLDKLLSFVFYYQLLDTTMCVETPASKEGVKTAGI